MATKRCILWGVAIGLPLVAACNPVVELPRQPVAYVPFPVTDEAEGEDDVFTLIDGKVVAPKANTADADPISEDCLPPRHDDKKPWVPPVVIRGAYQHGALKIPLPPGQWYLGGYQTFELRLLGGNRRAALVVYGQKRKGLIKSYMLAMFNLTTSESGWPHWAMKECRRTNMLYTNTLRSRPDDAACMYVNHIIELPMTADRADSMPHWQREAMELLISQGLTPPDTVLEGAFALANRENFVYLRYRFNPEYAGIHTPASRVWEKNLWHKRFIGNSPQRAGFAGGMAEWTSRAFPIVQAGFRCELPTGQLLPWPSGME